MKYYFYIVISFIIWSSYGILIKIFKLDPFALILYLSLFSLPLIFIYLRSKKIPLNIKDKKIFIIFLASLLLFLNTIFYFYALKFTSITNTILAHYAAPIIAAFFIPIFLNEKINKITIFCLIFSFIGILLLFFPKGEFITDHRDIIGISFGLASAVCYAFLIIIAKFLLNHMQPIFLMFYENFFSIILILLIFPIIKTHLIINYFILILYLIMSISHNFAAPILYLKGLEKVKAQHAAVLGYVEPLSAIILEIIFLKYHPNLGTIIGGLLIIISGITIIFNEV